MRREESGKCKHDVMVRDGRGKEVPFSLLASRAASLLGGGIRFMLRGNGKEGRERGE